MKLKMQSVKIRSIKKIEINENRYDLEIENNHNYYANNILVHNCRCIARKDGLWSRKGEKFLTCPHIEESLKPFFKIYPEAILDGELFNFELRQNLNEIMSLIRKTVKITDEVLELSKQLVKFYTYDGYGFGYEPSDHYIKRKSFIDSLQYDYVEKVKDHYVSSHEEIDKIYQSFINDNHEGAMLRRANSPYKFGRSNDLLKMKPDDDDEGIILEIKEGKGNWSGTAKTVTLQWNDKIFDATLKGSYEETLEWLKNQQSFIGKKITFKYNGLTGLGTPNYCMIDVNNYIPST